MLEFLLVSLFTILPDYLLKRYVYNKHWGQEITFFTMWYELRWGITACLILTIALITLIFFYHPSTTNVTPIYRTLTILPETSGRVDEVFVQNNQMVNKGDRLFRLESSRQQADVETARSLLEEVEAEYAKADARLDEAQSFLSATEVKLTQARDDLERKLEIQQANPGLISEREVELSQNQVAAFEGEVETAKASRDEELANINTILPAKKVTAEDALKEAVVELDKMLVYANVTGFVMQFVLQPGDIVNPLLRPAGLLIPSGENSGTQAVQAGFNQLAAPVIKPGTLAEIACHSKPFTIVPMIVTAVQPVIAAGQLRPTDQLVELQDRAKPGTLTVRLEPLYENGLDGLVPGSKCIANAYTNNHERIKSGELGWSASLYYHMVDTLGIVHALILRVQALMIPVKLLVFSGH